jgi:hypothetical protein
VNSKKANGYRRHAQAKVGDDEDKGQYPLATAFRSPVDRSPDVVFEIWMLRPGLRSADVRRSSRSFVGG